MRRFNRYIAATAGVAAVMLLAAACGGGGTSSSGGFKGVSLTGAGATFPDPIYEQWFKDFRGVESSAKINYQAIGSGGGVQQYTAGTVDFGASDAPLKAEEIQAIKAKGLDVVEIPTVLGGVVIAYNVSGVDTGLKLDGVMAAGIFLGRSGHGVEARRRHGCGDLPRKDQDLERPRHLRLESGRQPALHPDPGRSPLR